MQPERRQISRDRVIFGATAATAEHSLVRDCLVRNISDQGARVEFKGIVNLPKEALSLTIAKKGQSFNARVVWVRDNVVGVAFYGEAPADTDVTSELEEKLRISEKKQRQLQRKVRTLLGEG